MSFNPAQDSAARAIAINERAQMELRGEFFNIFKH